MLGLIETHLEEGRELCRVQLCHWPSKPAFGDDWWEEHVVS